MIQFLRHYIAVHGVRFAISILILGVLANIFTPELRWLCVHLPNEKLRSRIRAGMVKELEGLKRIHGSSYEFLLFCSDRLISRLQIALYLWFICATIVERSSFKRTLHHPFLSPVLLAFTPLFWALVDIERLVKRLRNYESSVAQLSAELHKASISFWLKNN